VRHGGNESVESRGFHSIVRQMLQPSTIAYLTHAVEKERRGSSVPLLRKRAKAAGLEHPKLQGLVVRFRLLSVSVAAHP